MNFWENSRIPLKNLKKPFLNTAKLGKIRLVLAQCASVWCFENRKVLRVSEPSILFISDDFPCDFMEVFAKEHDSTVPELRSRYHTS